MIRMDGFSALSLLVVGSLYGLPAVANAERPVHAKIVGGVEATPYEFPFIVSLQNRFYGHFCGGTLIKKDWVLTAAHCVDSKAPASSLKIVTGLHDLKAPAGAETFAVKQIISHPLYSQKIDGDFDFALIQLSGEAKFPPLALNHEESDIPSVEADAPIVTTAGWGSMKEGGSAAKRLMKVDVPLVDFKTCEKAYPKKLSDQMICAGFAQGGKDSCQGDSGGPLFMTTGSDQRVLVGVVSWGEGCARPEKYGVYAKVNTVVDWIEDETTP